jgi:hypothetical protein
MYSECVIRLLRDELSNYVWPYSDTPLRTHDEGRGLYRIESAPFDRWWLTVWTYGKHRAHVVLFRGEGFHRSYEWYTQANLDLHVWATMFVCDTAIPTFEHPSIKTGFFDVGPGISAKEWFPILDKIYGEPKSK